VTASFVEGGNCLVDLVSLYTGAGLQTISCRELRFGRDLRLQ